MKLLLIEDSSADAKLFKMLMEEGGYAGSIHWVSDGERALAFLLADPANRPDLIMLDLRLPRLSGHEVLKLFQADAAIRSIPVIVFSSSDNPKDAQQAVENGAALYLTKPSGLDEFEKLVQRLINEEFPRILGRR